tara:strand:- start:219 stop:1193 length:975 start_codon:yes stop_codon:yes gene_type:complete
VFLKINKLILSVFSILFCFFTFANASETIKIGSLQYGSVNWELDLIKELNLDEKYGVDIEIVRLASKNAAAVALQGKSVDLIVTDWFWVSRQRSQKRMFSFIPHSMAAGGLMVSDKSKINDLNDLKGKKIGIAGGSIDKSWLIFRAYYQDLFGKDLRKDSEQIFGAPPLLNKKIEQGSFDAILTYWPYQARLMSKDFKTVVNVTDVIEKLGIEGNIPVIGWVFRDDWAKKNALTLQNFVKASNEAKTLMLNSDEVWNKVKPSMNVKSESTFVNLRDIYRQGIPKESNSFNLESASKLFSMLALIGGEELVGDSKVLSKGTFWLK